jgi:hypothetical protein
VHHQRGPDNSCQKRFLQVIFLVTSLT